MRKTAAACLMLAAVCFSAQAQTMRPMSDAQFSSGYRCPESLPDAERYQELSQFLAWAHAAHPSWNTQDAVDFRNGLFETHKCEESLRIMRDEDD